MLQDCRRTGLRDPGSRITYWQYDQVYKEAIREAEKPSAQRLTPGSANTGFGKIVMIGQAGNDDRAFFQRTVGEPPPFVHRTALW